MPDPAAMSRPSPVIAGLREPGLARALAFIDGRWTPADDGATMPVVNPASGGVIGEVPRMGAAEARRAILAAEKAFPAWRAKTAAERAAILHRWFELMVQHADDLARIMTTEQGKPLAEARGEILYAASFLEWFAEEGKRTYGETIPAKSGDRHLVVVKEPVGVCAAVTPWNFPAAMITRKAGPALAVGCTLVLKPAPQTPCSALALAELAREAGVPPGVFSVVTGDAAAIGGEFTRHPVVRKISFTGSTAVGRLLLRQSADSMKKVTLELGGNAPFIVFADADLDAAVEGAMASKFRNAGQTCVCANRFLVADAVHDEFAEKLKTRIATLKVGDGLEPGITQGPLIDERAVAKVERHIADALAQGARLLAGGHRHALGGSFFEPTLLTEATPAMLVAREEIFGPVAALFRFRDEAEAVRLANTTDAGLAAYFYTRDIGRAWRVARQLDYGMVGINTGLISTEVAPFGGMKQSGLGREGSRYGLEPYLEIKSLTFAG